jgi:hypothetical protein
LATPAARTLVGDLGGALGAVVVLLVLATGVVLRLSVTIGAKESEVLQQVVEGVPVNVVHLEH